MSSSKLIALLRSPQAIAEVSDAHWNGIIEQGRKTQLLGQLAASLQGAHLWHRVPATVQRHLALADLTHVRRREAAMWEAATMRRAVDPRVPLVLLKGCAYAVCGDDAAAGRVFSDIDVLVRHQDLATVEADLTSVGWKPSRVNDYDCAYYRNWMHEVPPMEHVRRHTVVDLHHAINPPVSRFYVQPDTLFKCLEEVRPGLFVLSAMDRIIHCALHLLQEGEPRKLLRDLYDLHLLFRQHHGSAKGIEQLRDRARVLNVDTLIDTAIGAAHALFAAESNVKERSGWLQACVDRAAREANGSNTVAGGMAGTALLAYSHWMKMPMNLLLPHLVRKSVMRMTSAKGAGVG